MANKPLMSDCLWIEVYWLERLAFQAEELVGEGRGVGKQQSAEGAVGGDADAGTAVIDDVVAPGPAADKVAVWVEEVMPDSALPQGSAPLELPM
jgi:hypothetical protein